MQVEIRIHQQRFGYAQVAVEVSNLGLRTRHLVLVMSLGPERVHLRIAMAVDERVRPKDIHPLLFWLPPGWLAERIARGHPLLRQGRRPEPAHLGAQDPPGAPGLADGDGPVGAYRKWVRQFHSAGQESGNLGSLRAVGQG